MTVELQPFEITLEGEHEGAPIKIRIKGGRSEWDGDESGTYIVALYDEAIDLATGKPLDDDLEETYAEQIHKQLKEVLNDACHDF